MEIVAMVSIHSLYRHYNDGFADNSYAKFFEEDRR